MSEIDDSSYDPLQPGSPGFAAASWARAVLNDDDFTLAWQVMDLPPRLALIQSWMMLTGLDRHADRDMVAADLVSCHPMDLWSEFGGWRLERWRTQTFADLVEEGWGVLSIPEYVGGDLEFVRLARGSRFRRVEAGVPVVVHTLTMRLVKGR